MPDRDRALEAVQQSQLIEGEPLSGISLEGHWRGYLAAERAAEVGELLHPRVVHGLMFDGYYGFAGNYRHEIVGIHNSNFEFVPFAPPEALTKLVHDWWERAQGGVIGDRLLRGLHSRNIALDRSETLDSWSLHAEYEAIHPFRDGNGRSGRVLLWNMEMLQGKEITVVRYDERYAYYDKLEAWRKTNSLPIDKMVEL